MGGIFDAPQPPNPITTAAAQTGSNVSTAVANANLNNVNQVTPQGNLTYDQTSTFNWTDPTTGSTYSIPRYTATQTLPQIGQDTLDQANQAKFNLASIGNMSSAQLQQLLGSGINLSNIPPGGDASYGLGNIGQASGTIDYNGPGPQMTFGDAGAITRDYGDDAGVLQDRANVENSLFQRFQPQNERDLENMRSQLEGQGIKYGSPAYAAAMDNYNNGINNQRLGIVAQGGAEQKLQNDMLAQRAGFQNAAQQQQFTENQQKGTFFNNAQTNAFQQSATRTQALNAALAQQQAQQESLFNAKQTQRSQALAEQYALRDQPLNEISALLSGSAVGQPNFVSSAANKIPTTDVAGIINSNFSQSLDSYKQQSTQYNNLIGGLFSAIAGIKSDVRSKENIHKVGSVFASAKQKVAELPIYQYSYKDDPASTTHVGPMAQDVEKIDPAAVKERAGTKYINPARVMGSILKAA